MSSPTRRDDLLAPGKDDEVSFAMLPYHHMLTTEAQLASERRTRELEHRRVLWEARQWAKKQGRASGSRNPAAGFRALAAFVGRVVRTGRSPAPLPPSADTGLRA